MIRDDGHVIHFNNPKVQVCLWDCVACYLFLDTLFMRFVDVVEALCTCNVLSQQSSYFP